MCAAAAATAKRPTSEEQENNKREREENTREYTDKNSDSIKKHRKYRIKRMGNQSNLIDRRTPQSASFHFVSMPLAAKQLPVGCHYLFVLKLNLLFSLISKTDSKP